MPIYEFVCMSCESHFEELMRLDDGDPDCPDCGSGKTRRQLSVFATHGTAEQLVQELSCLSDERVALLVLVEPRRFADEHEVGVRIAHAEHDLRSPLGESAA